MKAHIINIGDELLLGDTVNTNASWMASSLDQIGIEVGKISVIGDDYSEITSLLNSSLIEAKVVLITGGLGPTHDDITKHVLCEYFNDELVLNEIVLKDVVDLLAKFGKEMNELNRSQALIPKKCEVIRNPRGTAPGMLFETNGKWIVSMPGVPHELKGMMREYVLPKLEKISLMSIRIHRYIKTFGVAEAQLAEQLQKIIKKLNSTISLAFLPSPGNVRLRLTAKGEIKNELSEIIDKEVERIINELGECVYGTDRDTLELVVGKFLTEQHKTISTAESCSGGMLASKITSVPGSSVYFKGSVIAYSNEIKESMLSVPSMEIEKFGAVSEEVVKAMAEGIMIKFKTDFGLATSGIAGPDGGSDDKPVGTIWIALSSSKGVIARKLQLSFDRKTNINLTADYLLDMLRKELIKKV